MRERCGAALRYGAPIDDIIEYVDDDGEVHRDDGGAASREYEAADEEEMLGGNPVSIVAHLHLIALFLFLARARAKVGCVAA
jgi:hypothetical protein